MAAPMTPGAVGAAAVSPLAVPGSTFDLGWFDDWRWGRDYDWQRS